MTDALAALARRAIPLIDLTSLNDDDSDERIARLCAAATTPFGAVAAVCVYGRFVAMARRHLEGSAVRIASVANFPAGTASVADTASEVRELIAAGAEEVDVVIPYGRFLVGEDGPARELLVACRKACGSGTTLKAILETGAYGEDRARITEAAELAIAGGADFIKTSTGKIAVGATPLAAGCILEAIRRSGSPVGLKVSDGIRDASQAAAYLALADRIMGPGWARPQTFRFGVSRLLDDLVARLKAG
jgi:deoxyribose-phosphate aldolase